MIITKALLLYSTGLFVKRYGMMRHCLSPKAIQARGGHPQLRLCAREAAQSTCLRAQVGPGPWGNSTRVKGSQAACCLKLPWMLAGMRMMLLSLLIIRSGFAWQFAPTASSAAMLSRPLSRDFLRKRVSVHARHFDDSQRRRRCEERMSLDFDAIRESIRGVITLAAGAGSTLMVVAIVQAGGAKRTIDFKALAR